MLLESEGSLHFVLHSNLWVRLHGPVPSSMFDMMDAFDRSNGYGRYWIRYSKFDRDGRCDVDGPCSTTTSTSIVPIFDGTDDGSIFRVVRTKPNSFMSISSVCNNRLLLE